jgi:folate-binding protein YgfZ
MSTLRQQWQSYLDQPASQPPASGSGRCYLPELCAITFSAPDAGKFLQGYLTCDTDTLSADALQPWALCNLQGRVVANGWGMVNEHDGIDLITHSSLSSVLADFFKPYLMFAKTEFTAQIDHVLVFGSVGTAPTPPTGALQISADQQLTLATDLSSATSLYDAGADSHAFRSVLFGSGTCLVTEATSGSFLPQMLGLEATGAVSFDKGCYLGQEVVARAQHRGSVKRRLAQLRWQGAEPEPGDSLTTEAGQKVGTIINSVASQTIQADAGPAATKGTALAVVANETAYPLKTLRDTVLVQDV